MDAKKQLNVRLPDHSHVQLEELQKLLGMTQVQVLILALDRLTTQIKQEQSQPPARYSE